MKSSGYMAGFLERLATGGAACHGSLTAYESPLVIRTAAAGCAPAVWKMPAASFKQRRKAK